MSSSLQYDSSSGWLSAVRRLPSPNFDDRPPDTCVDLVIVHGISLPPGEFGGGYIDDLFTNTLDGAAHGYFESICRLQVSAHLTIDRDGKVTQYVPLTKRAWHAGDSEYCGRQTCNDFSIGIELEGSDDTPYTDPQYDALIELVRLLIEYFPDLSKDRIVGHCDVAPQRKTDPGPCFDWDRLYAALAVSSMHQREVT